MFRARDPKLNRDVALKVLLPAVANDPDRLARFSREAQVLASLNHPNIAHIHGIEETRDVTALVMELVDGEDLSQRIARGPLPLDEALPIARQIAEAVESAHEHGIIHRDLKPANIKVAADGTVKVLDFGLAKAVELSGASSALNAPTLSIPSTKAGVILGTVAYMSPEQARGHAVDRRSDLWSFGVILHEMLTGTRLFEGATTSDTLAAVLRAKPDWTGLPADTPATIRRLLRRCLERDRKRRLDSAAAARLDIDDALTAENLEESFAPAAASRSARGSRLAWVVAAASLLGLVAFAVMLVRQLRAGAPTVPIEMRTEIATPGGSDFVSVALSPDGRQIVFAAAGTGPQRLWLRALGDTTAQPLAGTEGAQHPFWSPDNRSIAFFANGQLMRLDLGGGAPRVLAPAQGGGRGGTWNHDGVILFAPTAGGPLFRVGADGGNTVGVTTLERQASHRWPVFLPDGRHFVFYAQGGPDTGGLHLATLDGGATTRLTAADTAGIHLPAAAGRDGEWLLWTRGATLQAQRLDLTRKALTGDPVTLADSVAYDPNIFRSAVTASATGLVAYRTGIVSRRQLNWVDQTGKVLATQGTPDESNLRDPRIAPDGRRVAVQRTVQGNTDLWLLDGARATRLTFDAGVDRFLVWSPDSRRLVFDSNRTGVRDLYGKEASGAGIETRLVTSDQTKTATDWSADGRFLLFTSFDPQTAGNLWAQEMDPSSGDVRAGSVPGTVLATAFDERWGQFSPDNRWVAYQSNESGRPEIYVRPWVPPVAARDAASTAGAHWQVSTEGGVTPIWGPDGQVLYFIRADGALMRAPLNARGTVLDPGTPVALFSTRIVGGGLDGSLGPQYDVTRDGRFLINTILDDAVATPITLLQNWRPK